MSEIHFPHFVIQLPCMVLDLSFGMFVCLVFLKFFSDTKNRSPLPFFLSADLSVVVVGY